MSSRQTRKSRNNFVKEESPEEDKPLKPSNRTRRRSPLKEDKEPSSIETASSSESSSSETASSSKSKILSNLTSEDLFDAIEGGDINAVKLCVESGVDVNMSNSSNKFPLQIAIELQLNDIALYLLNSDVKMNYINKQTACNYLYHSFYYGMNLNFLKRLIELGVDINEKCHGVMPLHLACRNIIYKEITELLIKKGADVNALDDNMRTPLHYACDDDNLKYVQLLHKNGAGIIKSKPYYDWVFGQRGAETPVDTAKRRGNLKIIKYFEENEFEAINLEWQREIEEEEGEDDDDEEEGEDDDDEEEEEGEEARSSLFDVITEGNIDKIEDSIKLLSDINIKNSDGLTPLHYVISIISESTNKNDNKKYYEIFILLLTYGANPNIKNPAGGTPFALTCHYGLEELVIFMVNKSLVDINLKNPNGYTPLYSAILSGNLNIVKHLLDNGADLNIKNSVNQNTLHILCRGPQTQHNDIAHLLLDYSVDVNAVDDYNNTPLVYAISRKNKELQKLLIEYGATEKGLEHHIYSPHTTYEDTDFFHKINEKEMKDYYKLFKIHTRHSCPWISDFNISTRENKNEMEDKQINRAIYVLTYNNVPAVMMKFYFYGLTKGSIAYIEFLCANKDLFKGAGAVAYIHLYNFLKTKNPKIEIESFPTSDGFFQKQNMLSTPGSDSETMYYVMVNENDPPDLFYTEPQIRFGGNKKKSNSELFKNIFSVKQHNTSFMLGGGGSAEVPTEINLVDKDGNTPLLIACSDDDLDKMKELIAKGAMMTDENGMNIKNSNGRDLLHIACENNNIAIVDYLCNVIGYSMGSDKDGERPLHIACYYGSNDLVKVLIGDYEGAVWNVLDEYSQPNILRWTPLHFAISANNVDIALTVISYIKTFYPLLNLTDNNGYTCLNFACEKGLTDIIRELVLVGADVHWPDYYNNNPILNSVKNKNYEIVELLASNGADVNSSNKDGETPLQIALKNKDKKMKELLLKYGAIVEGVKHYIYSPNPYSTQHPYFKDSNYFESLDKDKYKELYKNVPSDFKKTCHDHEVFDIEMPENTFEKEESIYVLKYANIPASFMRIQKKLTHKKETKIIIKAFCTSNTIFQGVGSLAYRHLYNFLKTKLITISLQSSQEGLNFYPKLNMKLLGTAVFKSVVGVDNPKPMPPEYPKLLGGKTKNKKSSKRKTRKSKK